MLSVGERAPEFEMTDQDGKVVRSSDLIGKHNVVLFFYPKDNTLVCTIEVCAFRDALPDLTEEDALVLGVSVDSVWSHHRTSERWQLTYPLLSDPGGKVAEAYDVGRTFGLFRGRVTYIIDKEGIIKGATDNPLRAGAHVKKALSTLRLQSTS